MSDDGMTRETQIEPASATPARRFEDLPPAAQRALMEAEARRATARETEALPIEIAGRKGPEPVRFGDWEKNGIISDF